MSGDKQSSSAAHPQADAPSTPERRKKRILIIEDEPATRLVLWDKFRLAGFDVDHATNGHVALEKVRNTEPDAIFMDLLLPYVKGVDVIKEARKVPVFGRKPIYVCTSAELMNVWTRRGQKAGATKVFDKSTTPIDEIVAEVTAQVTGVRLPPRRKSGGDKAKNDSKDDAKYSAFSKTKVPKRSLLSSMKLPFNSLGLFKKKTPKEAPPPPPEPMVTGPTHITPGISTPPVSQNLEGIPDLFKTPQPKTPAPKTEKPMAQQQAKVENPLTQAKPQGTTFQNRPAAPVPKPRSGTFGSIDTTLTPGGGAVLTLDATGKIISADEACMGLFGWQWTELVGKDLKVLLADSSARDFGAFLDKGRSGAATQQALSVRLMARRKNGTEFPASITRLAWSTDTSLMTKSGATPTTWTAVFRDLSSSQTAFVRKDGVASNTAFLRKDPPPTPAAPPAAAPAAAAAKPAAPFAQDLDLLRKLNDDLRRQTQTLNTEMLTNREALKKAEKERDDLAARMDLNEIEVKKARTALEKEIEARKSLERQLQELSATKAALEKQISEESRSKQEFAKLSAQFEKQVAEAKITADRAEAARLQESARANRFEQELASMRQSMDLLKDKMAAEEQSAKDAKRQAQELEGRLQRNAAELERVRAQVENQAAERQRLTADLEQKLIAAHARARQLEAAWQEEAARNKEFDERLRVLGNTLQLEHMAQTKRLEEELAGTRQMRDELDVKLAGEQHTATESRRRAEELESRLREKAVEVERVKAEKDREAAEHQRLEREWKNQLGTADGLTKKLEAALAEAAARNKASEAELGTLRKFRDELNGKLAAERETVAESKRRSDELDQKLRENAAELERVKSELAKADRNKRFEGELSNLYKLREELSSKLTAEQQVTVKSQERTEELETRLRDNTIELNRIKTQRDRQDEELKRVESELRSQAETARIAAKAAEKTLKEKAAQCTRFEQQLAALQKSRDELKTKVTAEQQAAVQSKQRSEELEKRVRESAAELQRVKAESDRQRASLEQQLQAKLQAAKAATEKAHAELAQQTDRARRLDEEQKRLRRELEELRNKFGATEQSAGQAKRRSDELQAQLERVRIENEQRQSALETEFQARVQAAKTAAEQAQVQLREQEERSARLEREQAAVARELEEVKVRFASEKQAAIDSKRRNKELEDELNRVRTHTDRQHSSVQAELETKLRAAKEAAEKAQAELAAQHERGRQFDQDREKLRSQLEEVKLKLTTEKQGAADFKRRSKELEHELERLKKERERQTRSHSAAEPAGSEDASSLKAAVEQAEKALKEKTTLVARLERDTENLRAERQQLCEKFAEEKQAGTKAKKRIKDLEKQLREIASGFATSKVELEKRAKSRGRAENDLKAELEAARLAAEQAEAARGEEEARRKEFQREAAELRHAQEEADAKVASEKQKIAEATKRIEQLEKRLRESAAELARAKVAARHKAGKRSSESAVAATDADEVVKELARLRGNEAAHRAEVAELERRVRDGGAAVAKTTAELEKERGDRRRVEQRVTRLTEQMQELHEELKQHLESERSVQHRVTELEKERHDRERALVRLTADLRKEMADRQLAEEQLKAVGDMSAQLRQYLSLFEESKKVFKRTQEQLEAKLQASLTAVSEAEAKLQKETAERQRLADALATMKRGLNQKSEKTQIEVAKLQSELQVEQFERKRLEGDAQQSRLATLDSARIARNIVNGFQRQIREPVDNVMLSTKRLLESELKDDQKRLVESLLENALLLQANLEENAALKDAPTELRRAA